MTPLQCVLFQLYTLQEIVVLVYVVRLEVLLAYFGFTIDSLVYIYIYIY